MTTLESKLTVVSRRWPQIAAELDAGRAEERTITGDTPHTVLVSRQLHLSSAFDPEGEAAIQASRVPEDATEAWVYGVGAGYLPDLLLKRSQIKRLNLVCFNHALLLESLATYDHRWLEDPRVNLVFAGNLSRPYRPFAAVHAELELAQAQGMPLRDRVVMELNARFRKKRLEQRYARYEVPNTRRNRSFAEQDPDISDLYCTRSNKRVTVIAGGPGAAGYLAKPLPSDCLIVVSTALAAVLKAGLRPDIVVAIDGHPDLAAHFQSVDANRDALRNTVLAYTPVISPDIVRNWPGPRHAFYLDSDLFNELEKVAHHSTLYCSGTVTHCAVDLSVRMGASEVLLVGADFGFPNGYSHGEHAPFRKREVGTVKTLNWKGELIESNPALIGYLRDLEDYIDKNTNVRFYACSAEGAFIAGVTLHGEGR